MIETLFFTGGIILGFGISWASFKIGSNNTHQAYDVIYSVPEPPTTETPGNETQGTPHGETYDWDTYMTSSKWSRFEDEEDDLDEKPN